MSCSEQGDSVSRHWLTAFNDRRHLDHTSKEDLLQRLQTMESSSTEAFGGIHRMSAQHEDTLSKLQVQMSAVHKTISDLRGEMHTQLEHQRESTETLTTVLGEEFRGVALSCARRDEILDRVETLVASAKLNTDEVRSEIISEVKEHIASAKLEILDHLKTHTASLKYTAEHHHDEILCEFKAQAASSKLQAEQSHDAMLCAVEAQIQAQIDSVAANIGELRREMKCDIGAACAATARRHHGAGTPQAGGGAVGQAGLEARGGRLAAQERADDVVMPLCKTEPVRRVAGAGDGEPAGAHPAAVPGSAAALPVRRYVSPPPGRASPPTPAAGGAAGRDAIAAAPLLLTVPATTAAATAAAPCPAAASQHQQHARTTGLEVPNSLKESLSGLSGRIHEILLVDQQAPAERSRLPIGSALAVRGSTMQQMQQDAVPCSRMLAPSYPGKPAVPEVSSMYQAARVIPGSATIGSPRLHRR